MHRKVQFLSSPSRTIFLAVIVALTLVLAIVPASAQNSVPPTAVQAAKMPQYAWRLADPARRLPAPKSQVSARATKHSRPLDSSDIYDNGPINGNTDAWTINYAFITSDSFNIASDQTQITGMSFGAWLFSGDTLTSVEVSITSLENGGTSYFDQTVNFTQGNCTFNEYGYNICTETGSFNGPTLNAGTYWVNLQNASVPSGDPVYWDENSGVSCQGQGCPSQASQNSVGSIPSEAFTILGNGTTSTTSTTYSDYACPPPQPGFHDLHELSSNAQTSGLVAGGAGNLYGTFANGGSYGAGLIYDFTKRAGSWFVSTLYSFLGGSNGGSPNGVIIGPQGALYGTAQGANGYDLIYRATPLPTACATALCSWNETTIYQFTGSGDLGGGRVTAFDSAGNLYGIGGPGTYGHGAVFELSPSQGGWMAKVLYSFTGGNDGDGPNSLLLGHDRNLYGTTIGGGNNNCVNGYYPCGVAFQLVPSGSGWTENVLHSFTDEGDGYSPAGLIQDSQGNLYGYSICDHEPGGCNYNGDFIQYGLVFRLTPSGNNGWNFSVIYNAGWDAEACADNDWSIFSNLVNGLAMDAADNLYAAEGGALFFCNAGNCNEFVELYCGQIANITSGEVLVTGKADIFGNIASDANGNLYGTTTTCGFGTLQRNTGMIWQYSP
jgi:hypothetical protein